jgi:pyruvate kinase
VSRRTKIIASIGPACADEATLKAMVEAGMDVARLNLSHGTVDEAVERLRQIRYISETMGRHVGVMADLPGPKVRIGAFEEPVMLEVGQAITLEPGVGPSTADHLWVDYESLLADLHVGDKLAIGDGSIILEVVDYNSTALTAQVQFGGQTQGRPGLHIPSDRLKLTTPTPHDLKLLDVMVGEGVDMVALSFVRSAHDVRRVGVEPTPRGPLIVAKIETRAAVENLDGIIMESGAIMVARGDLGTECSIQDLPHLQKQIIARCIALGRPAITATQMLESMIQAPTPTRAEASDVANAVFDGSSAVMLSAETAIGDDPPHVVATMASIAERADQEFDYDDWAHALRRGQLQEPQSQDAKVTDVMTMATWEAAREIGAAAIMCISRSGFTVRAIARFRPQAQILAFSPEPRTIRQLTMSWGATPIAIDRIDDNVVTVHKALERAKAEGYIRAGDIVAVLAGSSATIGATDTLRMVRCP